MTLDKVNNRLFIGHHGNSRYDVYQLNEQGLPERRHADYGIGRNLIGRGFAFAPLGRTYLNFPSNASFDSVHQRLFVPDSSSLGPPGYRIMVFDAQPETLAALKRGELPEAIAVLGQPNFDTWSPGVGPAKINGRGVALVAEDRQLLFFTDLSNNRLLVWAILDDDYEISEYETGLEAVDGLIADDPDLVLLDISLPEMDGTEVLEWIRQQSELDGLPVIALTAHAMEGDREKYIEQGFNDYVTKPIVDEAVLKETIERWLTKSD